MAKLVYGLIQSLDGYVDHQVLRCFVHFIEQVRGLTGSVYGRRAYWDEDRPEQRDFASACLSQPKWVVSRTVAARIGTKTVLSSATSRPRA